MHVINIRYILITIIFIIFVDFKPISSNSQFCSTLHATIKEDICPNSLSFNITEEYSKPTSAWKLNIPIFKNPNSDIHIIEEIKQRFEQGDSCPYIRQTNKTICCEGWKGPACDKPEKSTSQSSFASCHLWGRDHIRTFDGTHYQFPGSCSYKLIGSTTWQINIEFINCTTTKFCKKKLTIVIAGKILEVIDAHVTNLTAYPSNLIIQRQEKHFLDLHFTNGVRLKIRNQHQQAIIIQLDENYNTGQALSGLCGDYNRNQDDDLKLLKTGITTRAPVEFGNQWKLSRTCPDVPPVIDNCLITTEVLDQCISLTNESAIFRSCFDKVDSKYFYHTCLNDVCSALSEDSSSNTERCQALEAYAEECREHEIRIQWRSKTGCSKRCPSRNMVFTECASTCRRTCQNPSLSVTQCHTKNSECNPGCVCTNDTIYDSFRNECVQLEECTCQYNNIQYQPGDRVPIDCNECTCNHGRWECTNQTCSRTCVILGSMSILTFDGKQYTLDSKCNQVLVETNNQLNDLRITYTSQENELNIQIMNTKVVIRQSNVIINGKVRHILPYQTDDVIVRRASTVFLEVRNIKSSVVLHYDPLTSRIYIKLHPIFVDRVRGLCGTYNYITNDDFLTPNNVIETNLETFANAYLASSCSIAGQQTDNCFNLPANELHARAECTNILKHPMFATCSPLHVDPLFFLTACIRDLCEDQSNVRRDQVKCSAIVALAHACALKGIVIDWMNNETLASTCQTIDYGYCDSTSGSQYTECVSECQSFCTDIDLLPSSCINQCLPGCTCSSGQFYDDHSDVCQSQRECSCFEPQSEQYIHPAHSLLIQSPIISNCSCSNGTLECTSFGENQCSSTQIYSLNATLCPSTCANYLSHFDCGLYAPGCQCPPGKVLLDDSSSQQICMPIEECPCQYNRQFYTENQAIIQKDHGCQNCTCQKGGIWSCEQISCSKTCLIFGQSHYQTFDGLFYNFPGACQYLLAKDSKNSFRILSQNVPCGMNGQICSKNIDIEYNGAVIDLIRDRPILVNNIELSNYKIQPATLGGIYIYQLGMYTVIKTNDFTVKWDGQAYLDITVQSNSEMLGLCGNNNDNFDDDLTSADGASQVNMFDMVKSWQTSVHCTSDKNQSMDNDPCGESYAHRRLWAKNKCDLIKIKSSIVNNPFEICIDKMETHTAEKYYQACMYDACHADSGGDCESVCTVLNAYAAECQSIIKTPIIKWRTSDRCPIQCDSGKVYMPCGPRCPQTCFEDDDYGGCIVDSGCIDGCFCPSGQVMDDNGQCVEPNHCPCSFNHNIYPQGSRLMMNKNETCRHECECQHGSFHCNNIETILCETTNCSSSEFTCESNGQCIPSSWRCDLVDDCLDGSDEHLADCQDRCLDVMNTFQCNSGQCINITHRCDSLPDCRDGSDEFNCSYSIPCKEYECPKSKVCIPKAWICDGTVDCGDEDDSDESGDCKFHECDTLSGRYFQCQDNFHCLPIEQKCDGHYDCDDGSDEYNCSSCTCTSSFSCIHTCQCIDSRRVCDGILDCIDGTDEHDCIANCAKDEYTCLDGKCLNISLICDGIRDCSKGEDEAHPDCMITLTTSVSSNTMTPTSSGTGRTTTPMTTTISLDSSPVTLTSRFDTTYMPSETETATKTVTSETDFATSPLSTEPTSVSTLVSSETSSSTTSMFTRTDLTTSSMTFETVVETISMSTDNGFTTTNLLTETVTPTNPMPSETETTTIPATSETGIFTTNLPTEITLGITSNPSATDLGSTPMPSTVGFGTTSNPSATDLDSTTDFGTNPNPSATDLGTTPIPSKTGFGITPMFTSIEMATTSIFSSTFLVTIPMFSTTDFVTAPVTYPTDIGSTPFISIESLPTSEMQSVLMNGQFIGIPEFSTPVIGSISDLNPSGKCIEFAVHNPSTVVTIILPLQRNVIIEQLFKLQILPQSNVNRFQLIFLNKQRQPIGQYKILSTERERTLTSPTIDTFPISANLLKYIRFLKIQILDTNDNLPPNRVCLLFQANFKQTKLPSKKECKQIDAMKSIYTTKIISKIGGTHPYNSSYGHLLQGYGGVTYNTSQAVIDIRIQKNIIARLSEISIPDYELNRTNVRKIIVELFDKHHNRLFVEKTTKMKASMNSTKRIRIRFIRVSILETNDHYAPYNVTLSVKGCFYRKYPTKETTKMPIETTTMTTKSTCYRVNALDPQYAHKIIGQFEGTQPLYGYSFVDFIKSSKTGVHYGKTSPIIRIQFQTKVVGQIDEVSIINGVHNIENFQVDLFDFNNNLLLSKQTTHSRNDRLNSLSILTNRELLVSSVQITILNTKDNRPARGIILSIVGCFSTVPNIPSTTTTIATTTTTMTPTTSRQTTKRPRDCDRIELMTNKNVVLGVTSKSNIIHGNLGSIGRAIQNGVTFSDRNPSIDIIFRQNILLTIYSISIISKSTNLQRFRIELLNNENEIQYKIESSSMIVNLESLPSIVLAGIRITFLQTNDNQAPKNIILSIQACVEQILITTPTTTTPLPTTSRKYPTTTPDHCTDIDAMQEPYSERTLAGLSGTNPKGENASLLDLIYGKSISFNERENETFVFIIFKPNLFVYLKYVGLISSISDTNVKRISIEYLDKNQLLIRKIDVDYSNEQNRMEPIQNISAIKITIVETYDGKSAKNVRLSVRGCFAIPPPTSTTTIKPTISTTTSTPCHHLDLMSNKPVATKVIAYIAGTNPSYSSILDYFDASKSMSYAISEPKFVIVFKANIYVELKSITIVNTATNVHDYKIDLIDSDRTIVQTITMNVREKQSDFNLYVPISALQITYLTTIDGKTPRNITLGIDGCFGINMSPTTTKTTPVTTTRTPPTFTMHHCNEIDMMNKLDSTILVDSITGTFPNKTTNKLIDYFNQTSLVSYEEQSSPISFLIIFKATISAEIHSISLISSATNVKKFQVDLIDDYKSIIQTTESNENLTVDGLTEIGIAALRITYIETKDNQPPKNIRLSIKGCFSVLPIRRRTTTSSTTPLTIETTTSSPQTTLAMELTTVETSKITETIERKCTMLDAMSNENRHKIIQSINSTENTDIFSMNGFSFNSTFASILITFKQGVFGNIDHISITGKQHNIKHYRVTFFDIDHDEIDEHVMNVDDIQTLSVDNVASIRIVFLDTIDNKHINHVQLSIHGCFFKIPKFETISLTNMTTTTTTRSKHCHIIDFMDKKHVKSLFTHVGGTLTIPDIFNATQQNKEPLYFILEFANNVFIRHIQNMSILTNNHHIEQIRIELLDKNKQLLKRVDLSISKRILDTNLYAPNYPIHVQYLKITITKGKPTKNITWSIIGCLDRIKKIKTIEKISRFQWWTVKCIHSNIMAGSYGYHPRKFLTPYITGTPVPIGNNFQDVMTHSIGISYFELHKPYIIEIDFPSGIIGRLFEVGIRSSNVYRIRVKLLEVQNGVLYTLTSPQYNKTDKKNTNPRLTGFPPVHSSGIRIILLDTIDGLPPRQVTIHTNGCFYKSSVKYLGISDKRFIKKTTKQPKTTKSVKPICRYSEWTRWGHCSVSCGSGVQIRARNQLAGSRCNDTLMDYRMCQLQPCMCILTKEFYMAATGQKVPMTDIVGYLKDDGKSVHIGDMLDTGMIVYTYNCSQFICSNIGLDLRKSIDCQHECVYLNWSPWSSCEGDCGKENQTGIQFRQRIPSHAMVGSYICEPEKQYRPCQTAPCFGSCILSTWSIWSPCSKSCNLGIQKRSRYYLSSQPNCTDKLEEIQDCNVQCCTSNINPTWSEWSPWGNCSRICNGGERIRSRTCKTDMSECKQNVTCTGSDRQVEPCKTGICLGVFNEPTTCSNGKVMSDCSNACGHTCNTLTCRSCSEPSVCVPGCVCPSPLVMNTLGQCIEMSQCLCQTSDDKILLVHGQTMYDQTKCKDCLCSNGCLDCYPSTKDCSTCLWSEWSPFGVCSTQCNGTQTRYRSRSCTGLETQIEEENRTCSTNETYYRKGCEQCSCDTITGQEKCHIQCAITPDICSNLTDDPFIVYDYIPPSDGQCCGSCNRTNKIEPCSVQQLPSEQIAYGDCISINSIARQQCLGTCISGVKCRCCKPLEITLEPIQMQCQRIQNNATITYMEEIPYAKIHSCSCQECTEIF